jgi:hypothetical protein
MPWPVGRCAPDGSRPVNRNIFAYFHDFAPWQPSFGVSSDWRRDSGGSLEAQPSSSAVNLATFPAPRPLYSPVQRLVAFTQANVKRFFFSSFCVLYALLLFLLFLPFLRFLPDPNQRPDITINSNPESAQRSKAVTTAAVMSRDWRLRGPKNILLLSIIIILAVGLEQL